MAVDISCSSVNRNGTPECNCQMKCYIIHYFIKRPFGGLYNAFTEHHSGGGVVEFKECPSVCVGGRFVRIRCDLPPTPHAWRRWVVIRHRKGTYYLAYYDNKEVLFPLYIYIYIL